MTNNGNKIDLAQLFSTVANSLLENRDSLNQADNYNQDHGDNMVNIFESVAKVIAKKSGSSQSQQLAAASKELRKNKSGSAKLYTDGLAKAAQVYKGKSITTGNAQGLLQALLGGGTIQPNSQQTNSSGADLLSSLLGGSPSQASKPQNQAGGSDLLGSLLGSLTGSGESTKPAQDDGFDLGDLINAGMAFMDSKQKGGTTMQSVINAILASSPLGQSDYRSQSGALVANTIIQALSSLGKN